MTTESYEKKRDPARTPEPHGGNRPRSKQPIFVIQKHDASTLHYDFRLEFDGVLKSWAVPKGLSTDPRDKRLALPTEDHPLDYADFEGVIPEDDYGAGTVLVWDSSPHDNLSKDGDNIKEPGKAIEDGHLVIELHGSKLKGAYALQRTGRGDDARWLLVKMDDAHTDARRNPVSTEPRSVISDRSLEDIAADEAS